MSNPSNCRVQHRLRELTRVGTKFIFQKEVEPSCTQRGTNCVLKEGDVGKMVKYDDDAPPARSSEDDFA